MKKSFLYTLELKSNEDEGILYQMLYEGVWYNQTKKFYDDFMSLKNLSQQLKTSLTNHTIADDVRMIKL